MLLSRLRWQLRSMAAQAGIPTGAPPSDPQMAAFLPLLVQTAIEQTVPELMALFEEWKPDVIVRSYAEVAGYLAAELAGIPHATAGIGPFGVTRMLQQFGRDKIQAFRSRHGLPPDPDLHSLYRYLYLSFAPPSFQTEADNVPTLHFLRPMPDDTIGGAQLPDWIGTLPDRPTVYITLGTTISTSNGGHKVFEKILAGMRDDALNLIVTVGRNQDPAALGPQPDNVHIERYIPMSLLLPHCDVVVAHGAFNTTITALSHGVPSLLIPDTADQPLNARRCVELGVGLMIPRAKLRPDPVRAAVHTLIEQPGYAERARHIQQEIAALPGPEHGAALLARLAEEKRPLTHTDL